MPVVTTRIFRSGNSEAVRLPREVAFGADIDVIVSREGDVVTIRPAIDAKAEKQKLVELLADLQAIGAPADGVQERDPVLFPYRRGL